MSPVRILLLAIATAIVAVAQSSNAIHYHPKPGSPCPPVSGDFNITNFRFYPEHLDWDPIHCKLYLGSDFNVTVLIFDPYDGSQKIIEFPGISHNSSFHLTGVNYDVFSGDMYFTANTPLPFSTSGADLTGPNCQIRFNTATLKTIYIADLAPAQAEAKALTGFYPSGFQDQSEDDCKNSYLPASYGNSIIKVDSQGTASLFYATPAAEIEPTKVGFSGPVTIGTSKLLLVDIASGTFATFDAKSAAPTRQNVTIEGTPSGYSLFCDGMLAPSRYNQRVLLCSDDLTLPSGSIRVFGSNDHWATGKYLGEVVNDGVDSNESIVPATVQIVESIYMMLGYFFDGGTSGTTFTPGNRSVFPIVDITARVDALVAAW